MRKRRKWEKGSLLLTHQNYHDPRRFRRVRDPCATLLQVSFFVFVSFCVVLGLRVRKDDVVVRSSRLEALMSGGL